MLNTADRLRWTTRHRRSEEQSLTRRHGLQMFDSLRREVGRALHGDEGMFLGFHHLEFRTPIAEGAGVRVHSA
jgi:hypothetical protein